MFLNQLKKNNLKIWLEAQTSPTLTGLPNWKVIFIPIITLWSGFVTLVVLQISGTSSGIAWQVLQGTTDPRLISGVPRGIRSDEWLVQQGWVVSQIVHGFPAINPHFPGGMDMTVFNDLPTWDWATIFRPHTWGYLLLTPDSGISWYWWLPAVLLISAIYLFGITIAPNKVFVSILVAGATYCSPFIQWWYQPTTILCTAWVFVVLSAIIWSLKSNSKFEKILWATITGYFSVMVALEIYVPFIVPGILIVMFCGLGIIFSFWNKYRKPAENIKELVINLFPLSAAAITSLIVLIIWMINRQQTIQLILNTSYPGQRVVLSGSGISDPNVRPASLFGAPWSSLFKAVEGTPFGTNSSEASSAFPIALIAAPALLLAIVMIWKKYRTIEWPLVFTLAITTIFVAFLYLPHWDFIAKWFGLSQVPAARLKIAFVMLLPIFVFYIIDISERYKFKKVWLLPSVVISTSAVVFIPIVVRLYEKTDYWNLLDGTWVISLFFVVLGTAMLFIRGASLLATSLIFIAAFVSVWGVNPVYKGLYNLNETSIGKEVVDLNEDQAGIWIGVGSWVTADILTQLPVQSLSGVQTYPIQGMWNQLDPAHTFENEWNRLGHTRWSVSKGPLEVSNPQADVISVEFNPCERPVNNYASYILSDHSLANAADCITLQQMVNEGNMKFWVYTINDMN